MRPAALVLATAGSLATAYFVGVSYSNNADKLHENLCLTNRALVRQIEQTLSETTANDLRRFGISNARWEKIRNENIANAEALRDASPCPITIQIPPDIVKVG